jgi:hypothetical protein
VARTLLIWILFFAFILGGAASLSAGQVALGVGLLLAPVLLLTFLTLAHYARQRRMKQ